MPSWATASITSSWARLPPIWWWNCSATARPLQTLPFQTFDNGIAAINTETCEALGLDLDTVKKAFAPYCTEVVEVTTAENFS